MNIPVYFLVRAWNAYEYFDQCIDSIFSQKNTQYTILYIDDASEYSPRQKQYIRKKLKKHIVVFNKQRKYAVRNGYEIIHKYVKEKNAIIINLDGDDWLIRDDVIDILLTIYNTKECDFTYGNCLIYDPGHSSHNLAVTHFDKYINIRYSVLVEKTKSFRKEPFLPLHLRTWKSGVYKLIPKKMFLYPNKEWIKCCDDYAVFFALLELTGNYQIISTPLCAYNKSTPFSDEKTNFLPRLEDEVYIRRQKPLKRI